MFISIPRLVPQKPAVLLKLFSVLNDLPIYHLLYHKHTQITPLSKQLTPKVLPVYDRLCQISTSYQGSEKQKHLEASAAYAPQPGQKTTTTNRNQAPSSSAPWMEANTPTSQTHPAAALPYTRLWKLLQPCRHAAQHVRTASWSAAILCSRPGAAHQVGAEMAASLPGSVLVTRTCFSVAVTQLWEGGMLCFAFCFLFPSKDASSRCSAA